MVVCGRLGASGLAKAVGCSLTMKTAQHSVHPTGGSLRVFRQFAWLGAGSGTMALPRPAHQRVTLAVGRLSSNDRRKIEKSIVIGGFRY